MPQDEWLDKECNKDIIFIGNVRFIMLKPSNKFYD